MTLALIFIPPPPSLNVTAFQHRFNTETLIPLHLVYTFSIHLYSTMLAMSSWIHCISDSVVWVPAPSQELPPRLLPVFL